MLFCNMVGNYWVELAGYKRHIARIGKFGQLNKYKINLAVDCIRYTNKYYCQRKVYKHDMCNCYNYCNSFDMNCYSIHFGSIELNLAGFRMNHTNINYFLNIFGMSGMRNRIALEQRS